MFNSLAVQDGQAAKATTARIQIVQNEVHCSGEESLRSETVTEVIGNRSDKHYQQSDPKITVSNI